MVRAILLTVLLALIFANVVIGAAPEGWTCDPLHYAEGAGGSCDCGCGVYDPDCDRSAISGLASEQIAGIFCRGNRQDQRNRLFTQCSHDSVCHPVPLDWTCEPRWYNELVTGSPGSYGSTLPICHCGCGTYDPDCAVEVPAPLTGAPNRVEALPLFCNAGDADPEQSIFPAPTPDSDVFVCSPQTATCQPIPSSWFCPARYYNELEIGSYPTAAEPACHCACGAYDPDCDASFQGVDLNVYCVSHIDVSAPATDYTCQKRTNTCTYVPPAWTCPKRWYSEYLTGSYGDDNIIDCDCGCGIYDPDCDVSAGHSPLGVTADATHQGHVPEVNIYCSIIESAPSTGVTCSKNSNTCIDLPVGWRCPPRWYNEAGTGAVGPDGLVDCDCGCGAFDVDCINVATTDTRLFCAPFEASESDKEVNECLAFPVNVQGEVTFQGLCISSAASASFSFLLMCVVAAIALF